MALKRKSTKSPQERFFELLDRIIDQRSMYWTPGEDYLKQLRRSKTLSSGPGKHQFEYPCEMCKGWFRREDIEKDHRYGKGPMSHDLDSFIERVRKVFIPCGELWQALCYDCHKYKSKLEAAERAAIKAKLH